MLTELCQELRNWFDRCQPKWHGDFKIENGALVLSGKMSLKDGQYFRIIGSALNDGVYQYGSDGDVLRDESFTGSIWAMAVPPSVVALSAEIDAWIEKNADVLSSPFSSESFGGYSYTKSTGVSGNSGTAHPYSWQDAFRSRLNRWRKI